MKVRLFYNLRMDDGVMLAGDYEKKEENFPSKLQREIQLHREGKQPRTTLEIIKEDEKKTSTAKKRQRKR